MVKYVLKRIGYSIVTLFVLVTLTFFMQRLLPGDPFTGDKQLPQATMDALYAKYGLDKPVWMQYLMYLGNCLHGDLGISLNENRPVTRIIGESFTVSFDVGMRAIIFAFVLGVLLGTVAAIKRGSATDTICMFVALVGVSVPSFIVGSVLQYFLGLKLYQATQVTVFATTGWDGLNSKILPVLALGFGSLAQISRLTRTSMHALRNAIMPVVTVLGPIAAGVLTGAFVVENIFAIPGLGRYFVQSIQAYDYTMISGTTIFYGAFLILANLVVDLVYGIIDPRVKLEEG